MGTFKTLRLGQKSSPKLFVRIYLPNYLPTYLPKYMLSQIYRPQEQRETCTRMSHNMYWKL